MQCHDDPTFGPLCEYTCATSADCPDPITTCTSGFCITNGCGTGTNGSYDGVCSASAPGANDGTCNPVDQAAYDQAANGFCIAGGTVAVGGACNLVARCGASEACVPGALCIPNGSGGVCITPCNPSNANSCSGGQYCYAFLESNGDGSLDIGECGPPTEPAPDGGVLSSAGVIAIPLYGCAGAYEYTAAVTIGTQVFNLEIDSESTTLAVAGSSCTDCSGLSPLYTPGPTGTDQDETTSSSYADGLGWQGEVYQDQVSVSASLPTVPIDFASITQLSGNFFFQGQTDCQGQPTNNPSQGILGLSNAADAVHGTQGFIDQLAAASGISTAFATLLCPSGGTLWFGGYDPAATGGPMQYTPMVADDGFYMTTLEDMAVGGTSLGLDAATFGPTPIDLGTTDLWLPTAAFDAVETALMANSTFSSTFGSGFFQMTECYTSSLTTAELDAALPTLSLTFPDISGGTFTLSVTATESYLVPELMGEPGYYCSGLVDAGTSGTTVGISFLRSQVTVWDRGQQIIGFAPAAGCP